jgi:copper chaperone CopZ
MKGIFYFILLLQLANNSASAQFSKAELQVAGLTCSLCSKSTETQLKKLDFIDSIQMDIAHARFILYFKKDKYVDFYQVKKKVEDAGFSVAMLKATYRFDNLSIEANGHFNYQNAVFYSANKSPQILNGEVVLQIVDKGFLGNKEYKKQAAQWPVIPDSKGTNPAYHVMF